MNDNPLDNFMKTFKQKKKRSKARKRDREKGIWGYRGMNHVCPNSKKPYNRLYYLYDDVSKMYLSDPYNQGYSKDVTLNNMKLTLTTHKACAGKMRHFIVDHHISKLVGCGAWRAIRVK